MNRAQMISRLLADGLSSAEIEGKCDAYLEERLKLRGAFDSRTDRVERAPVRHQDVHVDPELAELMKRFDAAPDVLEAYHLADPWLNGEDAALETAHAHVHDGRGIRQAQRSTRDDAEGETPSELADAMRRFDAAPALLENYALADPWLNGEDAARDAAERATFTGGRSDHGALSHAEVRAASARVGVNAFISEAEFEKMSAEQQAAANAVVEQTTAQLAKILGVSVEALLGGGVCQ